MEAKHLSEVERKRNRSGIFASIFGTTKFIDKKESPTFWQESILRMGLDRCEIITTGVRPGMVIMIDHLRDLGFRFGQIFKTFVHSKILFEDAVYPFGDSIFQRIPMFCHADLDMIFQ